MTEEYDIREEERKENEREYNEMYARVNDFTTLLNKHQIDYIVNSWSSGEGVSIQIGAVDIQFYTGGRVDFDIDDDEYIKLKKKQDEEDG